MFLITFAVGLVLLATQPNECEAHGRLIDPPSRASAWRYGFSTPPNYNDHELYCGGFDVQQNQNGGKCGECGDNWSLPEPRPNEYGGKWGLGVVTRKYGVGEEITMRVELTAHHWGYFEFRVCPELAAKQDCLDQHVLQLHGGFPIVPEPEDLDTRFYPRNFSRIYEIRAQLPEGFQCANCVLQWIYVAGNNWGICPDGSGAVGCGPQEQFRACADISIGEAGPKPPVRPTRPGTKATTKSTSTKRPTETEVDVDSSTADEYGSYYLGLLIAILTLLAVVCALVAIYLYSYHGQRIKHLMHWNKDQQKSHPKGGLDANTNATAPPPPYQVSMPPVAPPRTKRLSQTLPDIEASESSVLDGSSFR